MQNTSCYYFCVVKCSRAPCKEDTIFVLWNALGEAVGINFISAHEKAKVIAQLEVCADQDYFERGLELAIEKNGIEIEPVDISDLFAVEVDFQADLDRANEGLK